MFYIFHGDDSHSQKETLDKLLAKLGDADTLSMNTLRFSGSFSLSELRHATDAMPFLAKARVAIVENFFTSKPDKKMVDSLLDYLPNVPETTRLIFLEARALPSNSRALKVATEAKNGYTKEFSCPQGPALERWIRDKVAAKNGRISPHAIQLLAANIGSNLQILDNEIEKLLLYKGEGTIETADVNLMCPYVAEANIFDLVDAIGNRNGRRAATLLQQKLNDGDEPFRIFSMFVRQFRLLIQVKECAEAGMRPPDIAKATRQHSFVVGKLHQQCRGFSLKQLEQIYKHLLEVDIGVKTGRNDMHTALNLLVANLTL